MKKLKIFTLVLAMSLAVIITSAASPDNPISLNAKFIKWQEMPHIIHILVLADDGRPDYPSAEVEEGQRVVFGFEWGATGLSVDKLQEEFIENPNHDIKLSIDGGAFESVKYGYQDPFDPGTGSRPPWSWDHDGDGPGDGDGDGIGDWTEPIIFFRYQSGGLTTGTHFFRFRVTEDGGLTYIADETITVVVP